MYFIFQFRGKFIGDRVSELKRTFCCVYGVSSFVV